MSTSDFDDALSQYGKMKSENPEIPLYLVLGPKGEDWSKYFIRKHLRRAKGTGLDQIIWQGSRKKIMTRVVDIREYVERSHTPEVQQLLKLPVAESA